MVRGAFVVVGVVVVTTVVLIVVEVTDNGWPKSSTPSQLGSVGLSLQKFLHLGSLSLNWEQSGGQLKWAGSLEQGHLGSCPVNSLQFSGQLACRGIFAHGHLGSFPV